MKVGDKKSITVKPQDGYGDVDPEAFMEVPRAEFPAEIPLEIGTELELRDEDDEVMLATIKEVSKEVIRLDFNHPLAGQTLVFDVEILDLRAADEEELAHGHAHGEEDEFDEEDEEFDDEFIEFFDEEEEDDNGKK